MTKAELAEILALEHGITKAQATRIVQTFICVVRETMATGDTISLGGLGTFQAVRARERVGRNPRTGRPVTIEPTHRPKFIAGRALRHAVRMGNVRATRSYTTGALPDNSQPEAEFPA